MRQYLVTVREGPRAGEQFRQPGLRPMHAALFMVEELLAGQPGGLRRHARARRVPGKAGRRGMFQLMRKTGPDQYEPIGPQFHVREL